MQAQDQGGKGRSECERYRDGGDEACHGSRAVAFHEPVREIDDEPRIESRLRGPQQKSRQVELAGRTHEADRDRAKTPGDQDASDPLPRAPALYDQGAWDFEEEVAEKKDPGAKAEDRFRELQVGGHGQLGKAYIGAVQVGDDVQLDELAAE